MTIGGLGMGSVLFQEQDFNVFHIDGLEPRMEAIIHQIRPKFEWIGEQLTPFLSIEMGQEVTVHIAKHARRTVNPPDETWLAWSTNKRGYKALPHFQVGIRDTHLFIWFALIYECKQKTKFAQRFLNDFETYWNQIPDDFSFSKDHTIPEAVHKQEIQADDLKQMLKRLSNIKKAEFLCGRIIPKHQAVQLKSTTLITHIEETFQSLIPFYRLAIAE